MAVTRMRLSLVLVCATSVVAVAPVLASAKTDRAALAQLDAVYQPTGKLAAGPDRTQKACADAARLHAAADAIPKKRAPAGAAVDGLTWSLAVNDLDAVVAKLVAVCKAPDHKISIDLQGKKFETADQVVENLDHRIRTVLDQSRPRDLSPAMKKFQAVLPAMRATGKQLCAQHARLVKLLPDLKPPDRADATKWQQGAAALKASLDELHQFGCGTPRGADEEIAGSLNELHDRYYELVVLVPPRA